MLVNEARTPEFLKKFLTSEDHRHVVYGSPVDYMFYPKNGSVFENLENRMIFFKDFYRLAKSRLGIQFSRVSDTFYYPFPITTESNFLNFNISDRKYFSMVVDFDVPLYWYNELTNELGSSLFKDGVQIRFHSTSGEISPVSIGLSYENNWFLDQIEISDTSSIADNQSYIFAPAAKINRLVIRVFILEIKAKYPDFVIEFFPRSENILPKDEFGFLEGAIIL